MIKEQQTVVVASLAEDALKQSGDTIDAIICLIQAGAAIAMVKLSPGGFAYELFFEACKLQAAKLKQEMGLDGARQ